MFIMVSEISAKYNYNRSNQIGFVTVYSIKQIPFHIDKTGIEDKLVCVFEYIDFQLNCSVNFATVKIKSPVEVNRFGFEIVGICKRNFWLGFSVILSGNNRTFNQYLDLKKHIICRLENSFL